MGLVVRDGRAETLLGGDDAQPHVRKRGDCPRRPSHSDGRRAVQDHEGRGAASDCFRAVPREERQGGQIHGPPDPGRTSQGHPR